jgi:alpha-glucosidase
VDAYGEAVLRIRVEPDGAVQDHVSYGVVAEPVAGILEASETDAEVVLKSSACILRIHKAAFRVRLEAPDGTLLNEDEKAFGSSWLGHECTTYKALQPGERFLGVGEKTGPLDRAGTAVENWNTDAFAYGEDTDPMYVSTPFYIGVHQGGVYGILFDNTHRTHFNFGASNNRFAYFTASDGPMDYYLFAGPGVGDILSDLRNLTGPTPLPPRWSMGFQQCRYSYYPDEVLRAKAQAFRRRGIPCDVLYLDIHYMDAYKVFTWDKDRFPQPEKLLDELKSMGFRTVAIMDPGIAKEKDYAPYTEALDQDLFVKYPDGDPFTADVWPGPCNFPDFTKPEARAWWARRTEEFARSGLGGLWNDMNEPATWGQDMPDLIEFDYEGEGATHKEARNVYGQNMVRATREGLERLRPRERPFVLTRAGYIGIHRHAAVWTGDNVATDSSMLLGTRMVASMGLSGMSFSGNDIGGFVGDGDADLFARWISIGSFSPFFRCHTMINTRDAEPWAFGEKAEEIARNYINLRYRLLPYVYASFKEASDTGMPVVRSLAIEWPQEAEIYKPDFHNQFLFGPSLLVCPVDSKASVTRVFLPEGNWYYLYNDQVYAGGREHYHDCPVDRLPVFVRGGAILPMQSLVQHDGEAPEDLLRIQLYAGSEPSRFTLYEDDGETLDHEVGAYRSRSLELDSAARSFRIGAAEGDYDSAFKRVRIFLHGFGDATSAVVSATGGSGTNVPIQKTDFRYIEQLSNFDPWGYEPDAQKEIPGLLYLEFDLEDGEMEVQW